jgi:hypothetical protein
MVNEGSLLEIRKGVTVYDPSRGIDRRPSNQRPSSPSGGRNLPSPSSLATETVPFEKPSSSSGSSNTSNQPTAQQLLKSITEPQSTPYNKEFTNARTAQLQEQQRLAVNLPQYGGVYTSDGKFYQTTDKSYIPSGYKEGFADVRDKTILIVPKEDVPYAQSTKEGVIINKPVVEQKPQIQDTTKAMRYDPKLTSQDTSSIPTPTAAEQLTQIVEAPREIGRVVGKGYENIARTIGIPNKTYLISNETKTVVPQRVTSGGQDFTRPSILKPKQEITISPESIGRAIGTTVEYSIYAIPVAGTTILSAGVVKGGVSFFTGKSPEERIYGLKQAGFSVLGIAAPKAIEGLNKAFGSTYKVSPTIYYAKPKQIENILGIPAEEISIALPMGGQALKYEYPILGYGVQTAEGRSVKVTQSSFFRDVFKKKPTIIYEGNPFVDRAGYKSAIEKITGSRMIDDKWKYISGKIKESQAKRLVRYTAPKITDVQFKGMAQVTLYSNKENPEIFLSGKYLQTPRVIREGNIKTRGGPTTVFRPEGQSFKLPSVKDVEYYKSFPTYEKSFLTKQNKEYQKLSQAGKTKEPFIQISGAKPIEEGLISLPIMGVKQTGISRLAQAKLFQERSLMRKILPSGRIGRTEYPGSSKLYALEGEPPVRIEVDSPFKIEAISDAAKKETFSGQFTQQQAKEITKSLRTIYGEQVSKAIASKIPKIPFKARVLSKIEVGTMKVQSTFSNIISKTKNAFTGLTTKPSVSKVSIDEVSPSYVSSVSDKSLYYGKGTYEKTSGGQLPKTNTITLTRTFTPVASKLLDLQVTKDLSREATTTSFRENQQFKFNEDTLFKEKQNFQERMVQQQRLSQKQLLSQQERLTQQTKMINTYNPRVGKSIRPIKPNPKITPEDNFDKKNTYGKKVSSKGQTSFLALTKRFGKEKILGKFKTSQEAFKFGTFNIKSNLARSLKVIEEKTGKSVKLPNLFGFRTSKRDQFTMVQSNALSNIGETKEIQSYRKGRSPFKF